jgi:pilus assembly protein CpaE
MPNGRKSVRLEIKNESTRQQLASFLSSLEGFFVQKPEETTPADLLIMEMGDDPAPDFQRLNSIKSSGAAREIFLTARNPSSEVLIEAMRSGVKEFLTQPIQEEDLRKALRGFTGRTEVQGTSRPLRRGKIIDIIGWKGGVGTTTVAVNLADSIVRLEGNPSAAIIDMNRLFGDIPLFLSMDHAFNWNDISKNIARLDETYLMSILYKHRSGVYVLPSPDMVGDDATVASQVIKSILACMRNMFDYIIIDSGQSVDDISRMILQHSDKVLLVTVLSFPSLVNVKKLQKNFRDYGYPAESNTEVVVNRYYKGSLITLKDAEQSINKKFFWMIPNDYQTTMSAINRGEPLSVIDSDSDVCRVIGDMAMALTGKEKKERKEKRGFMGLRFP